MTKEELLVKRRAYYHRHKLTTKGKALAKRGNERVKAWAKTPAGRAAQKRNRDKKKAELIALRKLAKKMGVKV